MSFTPLAAYFPNIDRMFAMNNPDCGFYREGNTYTFEIPVPGFDPASVTVQEQGRKILIYARRTDTSPYGRIYIQEPVKQRIFALHLQMNDNLHYTRHYLRDGVLYVNFIWITAVDVTI